MKRRIIAIAASTVLGFSLLATPALAADPGVASPTAANPGLGHDCPGIVFGSGVYFDQYWPPPYVDENLTGDTTYGSFLFQVGDLATGTVTPGCSQAWYTVAFLPTDADGNVLSEVPVFAQTWKGDTKTDTFTASHYFTTSQPAGLCVYATAQIGSNITHYAPSDDPAVRCAWLELDPESSPAQAFRG